MRIATVIIAVILFFQSVYMLAFSAREGFSSMTLIAFGMALAPLVVLLIAYFLVRRRPGATRTLLICGVVIFLIMEAVLPASPFKTTVTSVLQSSIVVANFC